MVNMVLNDRRVVAEPGMTILQAAAANGVHIPNLCYLEGCTDITSCRICVVEVVGARNLVPSCSTQVGEGMVVYTHSDAVVAARKDLLELMLADHPLDCLTCEKAGRCKLQDYCYEYEVKDSPYRVEKQMKPMDDSNPFYTFDPNKCIMCRKCVKVCTELQCTNAIGFSKRGSDIHVTPPLELPLGSSTCVSCGNCVANCPVGALMPKAPEKFRTWEVKKTRTTCAYCGVGCQYYFLTKENKIVGVEPYRGPSNNGLLCVKGRFGYHFVGHKDRLTKPLLKKDGQFVEISWNEAYQTIADKINQIKAEHGPDVFGGVSSARATNEDNYMLQKFFRTIIGTNNVDNCARVCHAPTVAGLAITLGSGAMTNSIEEVLGTDVIFIIGSNTTEAHPVMGTRIRQAKRRGAKIIVADPRRIDLTNDAEIFLQIKPGTNIALLNGMMHVIMKEGLQDQAYIDVRTEGYEELVEMVKDYTPEKTAEICGIKGEDIIRAARLYGEANKAAIYYCLGITEHISGVRNVMSVSNLAMLCGNIGSESVGVNPLRGQNNVQGSCDMGCLPGDFPGYQKVNNPEAVKKFEAAWGVKLSDKPGIVVTEMFPKAEKGEIKFMYIMGENNVVTDPDISHVVRAFKNLDFLVVQDIFLTETAQMADLVLPGIPFAEKDGTFTNTERRVQRVRKAVDPRGEAKPDWQIFMELMNFMGYDKKYAGAWEVMDEIAAVAPIFGGITYERIEEEGIQWPCTCPTDPGTRYLHEGCFTRGKGLFYPSPHVESAELPDEEYPYILTTGRHLYHYHSMTMTGKTEGLNKIAGESYIEMNPVTAAKFGMSHGDDTIISSRRGKVKTKVRVTDILKEHVLYMTFHYPDSPVNNVTNPALDPTSKTPEFKVCAVRIEKA